jgi:hypothetical protein
MELHAPGALAEPVGLRADLVAGELDRPERDLERVGVPLVGGEAARQRADHVVGRRSRAQVDLAPADLRRAGAVHRGAGGARQQLGAQADAEHRLPAAQRLRQQLDLGAQVGVPAGLVDVHPSAEHDERVVGLRRLGRGLLGGGDPLVEPVAAGFGASRQDAGVAAAGVQDGEDAHTCILAHRGAGASQRCGRGAGRLTETMNGSGVTGSGRGVISVTVGMVIADPLVARTTGPDTYSGL